MKLDILFAATLFAISTWAVAANPGMQGNCKQACGPQHPMPNLMRIVKKHGDQLNLSDDQKTRLAAWREKSHDVAHGKLDDMAAIEQELKNAVIDGANRAQVNGYIARMDALRDEIVSVKLRCRQNMREILNEEQWQTLTGIYRKNLM